MTPIRRNNIRRFLLEILNDANGLLVPEDPALQIHLNYHCKPAATLTEMQDVLTRMESAKEIVRITADDGQVKAGITDQGRAARLQ